MTSTPTSRGTPDAALAAAEALAHEGRFLDAVEVLVAANREQRDGALDRRLVTLRYRAFPELRRISVPSPVADPSDDAGDILDADGVPSVHASDLTADVIRRAVLGRGCLIVRGLVDESTTDELIRAMDRAFDARDAAAGGAEVSETTPWFEPFVADSAAELAVRLGRGFVSKGSGMSMADSPRVLFDLLEIYEHNGLRQTISDYLGERPAVSVNKAILRRVPPTGGTEWWHQDGAFLRSNIRALNVWLSVTPSGRDAPGLDIIPKRLDHIIETGGGGADFHWSLGDEAARAHGVVVRPAFEAGDALLFDHMFVHRTGTDLEMTKSRYAFETWFFAPSAYPDPLTQVPLVY